MDPNLGLAGPATQFVGPVQNENTRPKKAVKKSH